jgi:hypothetical protein
MSIWEEEAKADEESEKGAEKATPWSGLGRDGGRQPTRSHPGR